MSGVSEWPDFVKWIMALVLSIITVIASGFIARETALRALEIETEGGQALLDNIGYSYFQAIGSVIKTDSSQKAARYRTYVEVTKSIRQDIRLLRGNAIYSTVHRKYPAFDFIEYYIVRELTELSEKVSTENEAGPLPVDMDLFEVMCEIYIESDAWGNQFEDYDRIRCLRNTAREMCTREGFLKTSG